MTAVERNRTIPATPDRVWEVLADFAAIGTWAPNIDHSCLLTEQQQGVGTVRRVQVGRTALVETVRSWEPGESLSYSIEGLPPVIRSVVNTWRLAAHGDGTQVSLTTEIDAGARPPQRVIGVIVGRRLAAASEELLGGLAAHLDHERDPRRDEQE